MLGTQDLLIGLRGAADVPDVQHDTRGGVESLPAMWRCRTAARIP